MKSLLFGSPGIPASTKPSNTINGVKRIRELGLDAMELEFVRSINVSKEKAPLVKAEAEKQNVVLTCHGQYWVNLNSQEQVKIDASIKRMLDAARRVHECGGWSITWHFAFYMKHDPQKVYETVKQHTKTVVKQLQDEGVDIWIRPETTGKPTQWGTLQETLKLSQELEQVMPCVDFGHLHARDNGGWNTLEEFKEILNQVEKTLGKEGLHNMHIQATGIAYGEKGEKHHLNFAESDFNYNDLVRAFKEYKIKGVVVTECPNIEQDALLLQKTYKAI